MTQQDQEQAIKGILAELENCRADLRAVYQENDHLMDALEQIELGNPLSSPRDLARRARAYAKDG